MDECKYVKLSEAAKFYNTSIRTIYRWKDTNRISYIISPSGQYLYGITEISVNETKRTKVIYIRVSSSKQKDDLQRQKDYAIKQFPFHKIISDVGSGLNFKRTGLRKLLKMVFSGSIEEIVITSKDRLCRFGYDLIEWLCSENSTKILVLDRDQNMSKESEFVRDVLSIIQIYTCKWNGSRRYNYQGEKNQIEINIGPKTTITKME
jgi:predicted site-specific integrase-resolvase